ncbi:glutamate--tRNA ligase, cytoplasmic [Tanacetum coccineum]
MMLNSSSVNKMCKALEIRLASAMEIISEEKLEKEKFAREALFLHVESCKDGASRTLNLIEWDKLWNINKKIIDPVCPRYTAIAIAEKKSPNVEVALMDWGNAIVEEIKKDSDGNVTELSGKLHLEGYVKAAQLKLTWLPEINELTPLTLVEFGYLITRKKPREVLDAVTEWMSISFTEAQETDVVRKKFISARSLSAHTDEISRKLLARSVALLQLFGLGVVCQPSASKSDIECFQNSLKAAFHREL